MFSTGPSFYLLSLGLSGRFVDPYLCGERGFLMTKLISEVGNPIMVRALQCLSVSFAAFLVLFDVCSLCIFGR